MSRTSTPLGHFGSASELQKSGSSQQRPLSAAAYQNNAKTTPLSYHHQQQQQQQHMHAQQRPASDILGSASSSSAGAGYKNPEAEAIDRWFEDLSYYESTLEQMAKVKLDDNFREELKAIEQWFTVLTEAERTTALYSLLQHTSLVQVKFLSTVLAQKASAATARTLPPGLSSTPVDKLAAFGAPGGSGSVGSSRSMTNLSTPTSSSSAAVRPSSNLSKPALSAKDDDEELLAMLPLSGGADPFTGEMRSAPVKQVHSPIIRPRTPTDDAINSVDWSIGGQSSPTSANSGGRGDILGGGGYNSAPLMGRPLSPAFHGSAPNLSPSLIPARPQSPSIAPARPMSPALAPARPQSPSMSHSSPHSPLGYSATTALGFSTPPPPPGFGGLQSFGSQSSIASNSNNASNNMSASSSFNNNNRPQSPSLLQGVNPHLAAAGRPQSPGARAFTPGGTPGNPIAAPSRGSSLANEPLLKRPMSAASAVAGGPVNAASVVANGIARSKSPQVQVHPASPEKLHRDSRSGTGNHPAEGWRHIEIDRLKPKSVNYASSEHSDNYSDYGGEGSVSGMSSRSKSEKGKIPETIDLGALEDIPGWLKSLRLHKYTPIFQKMHWKKMVVMTDEQLEQIGVAALGARNKMIKVFELIRKECEFKKIAL